MGRKGKKANRGDGGGKKEDPDSNPTTTNTIREKDHVPEKADTQVPDDDDDDAYREQQERAAKEARILAACEQWDVEALQELAQSPGGFLTDELRQEAWPILLGLPLSLINKETKGKQREAPPDDSWKTLPPHRDEEQVQLDVARAFVYYPDRKSEHDLELKKKALSDLILSVLRRHPFLHYFQGYHDIAQVFLLVLPPRLQGPAVARLSLLRIRDFMLPTLAAAVAQLRLLPAVLRAADPPLWRHLAQTEPFFALAGTLTMYAHDVPSLGAIARLFDALLARPPVFSVYLFAAIVLARRAELFAHPADEPEMLHAILSKLPRPLDLEALLARADRLCAAHPPGAAALGRAWRDGISPHSVLKTVPHDARPSPRCYHAESEAVGEYHFSQHVLEIARQERRERLLRRLYQVRRPAGAVGVAVLFGVLAYWLRKTGPLSTTTTTTSSSGFLAPVVALFSKWWPLRG